MRQHVTFKIKETGRDAFDYYATQSSIKHVHKINHVTDSTSDFFILKFYFKGNALKYLKVPWIVVENMNVNEDVATKARVMDTKRPQTWFISSSHDKFAWLNFIHCVLNYYRMV